MYTYSEIFVGIPLSQFNTNLMPSKSKEIVNEMATYTEEDLSLKRLEDFLDDSSNELKEIMQKLIDFRNGRILNEYYDFITDYDLDFKSNYNGGEENPLVFGFYINELMPIPDIGLGVFSEDVATIYKLQDRMKKFCYEIFGEKIFNDLDDDKLIGVFWNNHSS